MMTKNKVALKANDIVEIIDSDGCNEGYKGDICMVLEDECQLSFNSLVVARIITGEHYGKLSSRYSWRYKKIANDWDI